MPAVLAILAGIVQIADVVVKFTSKNPDTASAFGPIMGSLVAAASQAAGETAAETAARLAAHDAIVSRYSGLPPLTGATATMTPVPVPKVTP